jgi:hypothetical protein
MTSTEFEIMQIESRVKEINAKNEITDTDLKNAICWINQWKILTNWKSDETPALQYA